MQKLYKITERKWRGYEMQTSSVCLAIYNFLWFRRFSFFYSLAWSMRANGMCVVVDFINTFGG